MQITDQHRKQLQMLMQHPAWSGFEAYYQAFLLEHFAQASIKRSTEFDTVWYAAEAEGGKRILAQFVQGLEQEARKVELNS